MPNTGLTCNQLSSKAEVFGEPKSILDEWQLARFITTRSHPERNLGRMAPLS